MRLAGEHGYVRRQQRATPSPGCRGIEIKVTLGAELVDAGLAAFDLSADAAQRRRIWFCEHLDGHGGPAALPLFARGLILRVRSKKGSADDSTLKLRGPEGCVDPEAWHRRTQGFGQRSRIEGDWVGERHLVSASLDNDIEDNRIEEVLAERPHRVSRLFSKEQESLARDWLLPLHDLDLLGPVHALKWQQTVRGLEHRLAAELWEVDEGLRFLELSLLVERDPIGAQRGLEQVVQSAGLDISSVQETKTRLVLEHLAAAISR
jgi:hypothetical protein